MTAPRDVRSLARSHTEMAVNVLAGIAKASTSDAARVSAAVALLERGWGKPQADVAVDGEIRVTIRKMLNDDGDEPTVIDVTPERKEIG